MGPTLGVLGTPSEHAFAMSACLHSLDHAIITLAVNAATYCPILYSELAQPLQLLMVMAFCTAEIQVLNLPHVLATNICHEPAVSCTCSAMAEQSD